MKCVIFAAGYATRLYPLTKDTPKPLLKVAGTPMIEHILQKIECHKQIKDVYIVTNSRFAAQFDSWNQGFRSRLNIKIVDDGTDSNENRLGAIGDLKYVLDKEAIKDDLLLIAGDNLFEDNLGDLIGIFLKNRKPTIGVIDVGSEELAKNYGVVEIDRRNIIKDFSEKPQQPQSTLISTFVYALPAASINIIHSYASSGNPMDRAGDFIKHLSMREEVFAVPLEGKWFDIGTLDQYHMANKQYTN